MGAFSLQMPSLMAYGVKFSLFWGAFLSVSPFSHLLYSDCLDFHTALKKNLVQEEKGYLNGSLPDKMQELVTM